MYIRTKDGVYEVEQSQLEDDEEVVNCDYGQIHKLEILRKSENLEELCDEFVIIPNNDWSNNWLAFGVNKKCLKDSIYNLNYPIKEVYGAIWTEWGLKYVAKMNDDRELELL